MGKIDVEVKDGRVTISVPADLYAVLNRQRRKDGTITPQQFGAAFDEWRAPGVVFLPGDRVKRKD